MRAEEYLKKNGIKVTKGRINILRILIEAESALTVENILERYYDKQSKIDVSTIYRSLETFCNKRIIKKFDLGKGKYSYAIKKEDHKHIVQCKVCRKSVEIDCPMQQIEELIKSETGFSIIDENLDLKIEGICETCKKGNCK